MKSMYFETQGGPDPHSYRTDVAQEWPVCCLGPRGEGRWASERIE